MTEQKKRGMKSLGAMLEIPKAGTTGPAIPAPAESASSPAAVPTPSVGETPAVPAREPAVTEETVPTSPVRPSGDISTPEAPDARPAQPQTPVRPHERYRSFEDFERKDTRQRNEQIAWIEAKRKELNRLRAGSGERLTDNTLYRVAIDLLISRGHDLAGATESELRASLGLDDRDLV